MVPLNVDGDVCSDVEYKSGNVYSPLTASLLMVKRRREESNFQSVYDETIQQIPKVSGTITCVMLFFFVSFLLHFTPMRFFATIQIAKRGER